MKKSAYIYFIAVVIAFLSINGCDSDKDKLSESEMSQADQRYASKDEVNELKLSHDSLVTRVNENKDSPKKERKSHSTQNTNTVRDPLVVDDTANETKDSSLTTQDSVPSRDSLNLVAKKNSKKQKGKKVDCDSLQFALDSVNATMASLLTAKDDSLAKLSSEYFKLKRMQEAEMKRLNDSLVAKESELSAVKKVAEQLPHPTSKTREEVATVLRDESFEKTINILIRDGVNPSPELVLDFKMTEVPVEDDVRSGDNVVLKTTFKGPMFKKKK